MTGSDFEPDVTERILEAAQGNPLFLEQVIAHLLDQPGPQMRRGTATERK